MQVVVQVGGNRVDQQSVAAQVVAAQVVLTVPRVVPALQILVAEAAAILEQMEQAAAVALVL